MLILSLLYYLFKYNINLVVLVIDIEFIINSAFNDNSFLQKIEICKDGAQSHVRFVSIFVTLERNYSNTRELRRSKSKVTGVANILAPEVSRLISDCSF